MKSILSLCIFLSSTLANAGSADCTGTTNITASGNYYADTNDCIVSVNKSIFEFTYVWLPGSPSVGDEFTIKENTTAQQCDPYEEQLYCWPAGVGVQSVNAETMIDGVQGLVLSDFHQYLRVRFDGTEWVPLEIGYF